MASPSYDSPYILGLKAAVTGTTLLIAGGMASTSFQFLPSLILTAQRAPLSRSSASGMASGRLTPAPTSKTFSTDSTSDKQLDGYKLPAQQFVAMSKTAFATQVPPELLSIIASGFLAYHSFKNSTALAGYKWTATASLIAIIFPLTGGLMVPLDHKIARISGDEEKVEAYEDSPLDRDAERRNTVEFLTKWNVLNSLRSVIMFAAGGIGLWGLVE